MVHSFKRMATLAFFVASWGTAVSAQQATVTLDRSVLPIADRKFGGTGGRTIDKSTGDWSIVAGVKAPDGAPNVLIVLIDDAGFGSPDTFGGAISTPNLTRIADAG